MNLVVLVGISVILQLMYNEAEGACKLTFTKNIIDEHQPIFLINRNTEYELVRFEEIDDKIQITIPLDKHIKVACASRTQENVGKMKVNVIREMYTVYCIRNEKLIVDNEENVIKDESDIEKCSNITTHYVITTSDACGGGEGKIYKVGFYVSLLNTVVVDEIQRKSMRDLYRDVPLTKIVDYFQPPPQQEFLEPQLIVAYEACVKSSWSTKEVLYTLHSLYGPALKIGKVANGNDFKKDESYSNFRCAEDYDAIARIAKAKIFTEEQEVFIILQQAVPPMEMPSYVFSLSTLHTVNSFTMWKSTESTWMFMEAQIRRLAERRSIEFEIYTGKLADSNSLWKIVQYKFPYGFTDKVLVNYKGIAFIVDNSQADSDNSLAKTLCNKKQSEFCEKHGWILSTENSNAAGIGCCYEVHSLLNHTKFTIIIPEISNIVTPAISGIFHYKSSPPKKVPKDVVVYEILSFNTEMELAETRRQEAKQTLLFGDSESPVTTAWPESPKKTEVDISMASDVFTLSDNLEAYLAR